MQLTTPPAVVPDPIPIPKSRGQDALDYLEANGVCPWIPPLAASDAGMDEFTYYLSRRLRLRPVFQVAEALTHGTFFHLRAELDELPPNLIEAELNRQLEKRKHELTELGKAFGMGRDAVSNFYKEEEKQAKCAFVWFEAVADIEVPGLGSIRKWLRGKGMRTLGSEIRIEVKHPDYPKTPCVIKLDRLIYQEETNTLWIIDFKTSGIDAIRRAQICPTEFQTLHYIACLQLALTDQSFREKYNLPADVSVGGITHVIVRKPSILLSKQDCDGFWTAESKRSGVSGSAKPVEGQDYWKVALSEDPAAVSFFVPSEDEAVRKLHEQVGVKPTKVSVGEPRLENYLKRVRSWYAAEGEYEHLKPEWASNPPVVIHRTFANTLEEVGVRDEYEEVLANLYSLATRPPLPENFNRIGADLLAWGRLSPYAPFYLCPVRDWPAIIQHERFVCYKGKAAQ